VGKESANRKVSAFAPASIGNVAVGFDILGLALPMLGDIVEVSISSAGVTIEEITGLEVPLPSNPEKNTAGKALIEMIKGEKLDFGFSIKIKKGIPLGSGMGGSAASAVAAVVAANEFLTRKLNKEELFNYAVQGEAVASGVAHGDNVAPALFGGITLCLKQNLDRWKVVELPYPKDIYCTILHPHIVVETKMARAILQKDIALSKHIEQSSHLASFLVGLYNGDWDLLQGSVRDVIIEPQRSSLIPHFDLFKKVAWDTGCLGFSISGAGPSVFALSQGQTTAKSLLEKWQALKQKLSYNFDLWSCEIDCCGARLMDVND